MVYSIILLLISLATNAYGDNLGRHKNIYPIIEENPLEIIENKLKQMEQTGELQKLSERITRKLAEPASYNLPETIQPRIYYLIPKYVAPKDVKDEDGNIIVKSGTEVNPLENVTLRNILFIDGTKEQQAALIAKHKDAIIYLTGGKPFELADKYGIEIYYAQNKEYKKFDIKQVPALIVQEGLKLKVSEFRP